MPSPKTEPERRWARRWPRLDARSPWEPFQRLNVRLALSIAIVALVGLTVSGLAIQQILPGYFEEQTRQRLQTSAASTLVLIENELTEAPRGLLTVEETRNTLIRSQARAAAEIFNATVTVIDARTNERIVVAEPEDIAGLEAQGLRRDAGIQEELRLNILAGRGLVLSYDIILSDPYSSREATLRQIAGVTVAAGLIALAASLIVGIVAARSLTVPIGRLRRVAGRVAQGHLDERAAPSGVLEVDELGHQFNVMADRLGDTLRTLEADRDRLREFVADVSHELRTPIAALRMYTELLSDGEVDEATRREFLDRSAEQIRRLEWLSTNLLDLSRIDAGIFPLDIQPGDLRDPVQAVVQALSEVAVERGVSLDSVVPAHPVEMSFDRERIIQLLTNLLGNALKFTPAGGFASVRLEEADDGAILEVRDNGPGIPPDELPHIFDRFYRGTNTGEARASGSGLGLAIVRSIVEMHGGEIDVASVVGEGTAFRITLPRHAVAPATTDLALASESDPAAHEVEAPEAAVEPAPNVNETSPSEHPAVNERAGSS